MRRGNNNARGKNKRLFLACSEHAKLRLDQRYGITKEKDMKKFVRDAYKLGIKMSTHYIPKNTLSFINKKLTLGASWRIYQDSLFIFSKTLTLITVFEIPEYAKMKRTAEQLERVFSA